VKFSHLFVLVWENNEEVIRKNIPITKAFFFVMTFLSSLI